MATASDADTVFKNAQEFLKSRKVAQAKTALQQAKEVRLASRKAFRRFISCCVGVMVCIWQLMLWQGFSDLRANAVCSCTMQQERPRRRKSCSAALNHPFVASGSRVPRDMLRVQAMLDRLEGMGETIDNPPSGKPALASKGSSAPKTDPKSAK
eukprot:2978377-Rhodomonas_salina.1